MNDNRYLIHYGVKGMKWGVRKDRTSEGKSSLIGTAFKITHPVTYTIGKKTKNGLSRAKNSNRYKNAVNRYRNLTGSRRSDALAEARRKNINTMSNKELNDTVYRLNLERNYRSLTKLDINRGQNHAKDMLKYDSTYKAVKNTAAYKTGKKVVRKAVTKW